MLSTSVNTLTATSRLVFDQITGHHNLARLTHKFDCHSDGDDDGDSDVCSTQMSWHYHVLVVTVPSALHVLSC